MWGKEVYNVEKSYVDKQDARKPRGFSLFNTSHEYLIDQKDFNQTFQSFFSQYLITSFLIVVRQEVGNLDRLVVVYELELAINRALYGCLCNLGSQ